MHKTSSTIFSAFLNISSSCSHQSSSDPGWSLFYRIIYRNFEMETEAHAIHTGFHAPNSISFLLNESRNKEMELRLGESYASTLRTTLTNINRP